MLVRHRRGSLSYDTDSNHMRASRFLTGVDGISEIKFKICSPGVKLKKTKNYFHYYYLLLSKRIIF